MLTVAAGIAVHGRSVAGGNLGSVLRKIATGDGRGYEGLSTFDARFRRLLSCSTAPEVCEHLAGVLRTAERKGVPVDFARLYRDLTYWSGRVKVEWARDYWGTPRDEAPVAAEREAS
jgi:CRISPR type I-E-associated protein CasB/Cse2